MPHVFRTFAGFAALPLDGTALAVMTSATATGAASINRARLKIPHPDADRIAPAGAVAVGARPFRPCDAGGAVLTQPGATTPRAPVSLDVVTVASLPLGARAFVPSGDGAWVDAILTRTPDAILPREVFDGGNLYGNALPPARPVTSLPVASFAGAVAGAMFAGQTSSLPGFDRFPAVTFDRTSAGRPVFVGGAHEFSADPFTTLGALAGPDPARIILIAENDGTPTSGDVFACVCPAFLV